MFSAVQTMTTQEVFDLEAVAHLRQRQIADLSALELRRIEAKRAK